MKYKKTNYVSYFDRVEFRHCFNMYYVQAIEDKEAAICSAVVNRKDCEYWLRGRDWYNRKRCVREIWKSSFSMVGQCDL